MKKKILFLLGLMTIFLISELKCAEKKPAKYPSQKELNELTLILTKYGNNPEGAPPLHYAIIKRDIKALNLLIKHGADPQALDCNKNSGLYYAIKVGSIPLIKKLVHLANSPLSMSNSSHNFGNNALYNCFINSQYKAAKYIITSGLHNHETLEGSCFFLIAYNKGNFSNDQRKELVNLMIKHGLNLNSMTLRGRTQLGELLASRPHDTEMADFLKTLGAE